MSIVALPYFIIGLALTLARLGLRPAMINWAVYMLGALSGLGVAIWGLVISQALSIPLALIALAPLGFVAVMLAKDLTHPLINDVSTDIETPPLFAAALRAPPNHGRDMAFPKRNSQVISTRYSTLNPLILRVPRQCVFQQAHRLVEELGWQITKEDRDQGLIEAEVTTSLLRFVDDVIVRIRAEGGNTCVDMRSKSREGLVDGGYNAKRIESFFNHLADRFPERHSIEIEK